MMRNNETKVMDFYVCVQPYLKQFGMYLDLYNTFYIESYSIFL